MNRVLIIEDGHEYIENLRRFMGEGFELVRAGDGQEALEILSNGGWNVILLDMCFDRAERLLGEEPALLSRMGGDLDRMRTHLEIHQGTYILAAIRQAGHSLPVVFSYDFDAEPRRFSNLQRRYAPLSYLNDVAGPQEFRTTLGGLLSPE
jgi:DNA-binding NarL/FixJ family response regulator